MIYRKLAGLNNGLSCIGFGCWQLGSHGWGSISETEIVRAVHKAIENGITLFDTAPIYGLGHSEELLGKALGVKRKNIIIATKVGLIWNKNKTIFTKKIDSSPANINREIDMSLKRLRTDYIDIYQIHWYDPKTPIEDTLGALQKLKELGKIRLIGGCNLSLELLKESLKYSDVATLQAPYNLIDRHVEQNLLPFCREKGIGVLAYSPIARGLLSGKYNEKTQFPPDDHRNRSQDAYFSPDKLQANLKVVNRLKIVAQRLNKTPAQVAIRWVLENPGVTAAISGVKNVAQVEENVASSDFDLPQEDIVFLSKNN